MSDNKTKMPPRDAERLLEQQFDATLDQELDDSFPASDPPQSTQPSKAGGPYRDVEDKAPVRERHRARA
jgi:hypothetical protein